MTYSPGGGGTGHQNADFQAATRAYKAVADWIDADTGRSLFGCTPSMVAGVAINAYRVALTEDHGSACKYAELRENALGWQKRAYAAESESRNLTARLTAFARTCVLEGDMTPAAERMLLRILKGES